MPDTVSIAKTRKGAYLALLALADAAKSAAAHLSHTDYETVCDYCTETLEWIADRDDSIPPCQDCGNEKATADTREDSHPRCAMCQRQHDEDAAMRWDEAHPPRPTDL